MSPLLEKQAFGVGSFYSDPFDFLNRSPISTIKCRNGIHDLKAHLPVAGTLDNFADCLIGILHVIPHNDGKLFDCTILTGVLVSVRDPPPVIPDLIRKKVRSGTDREAGLGHPFLLVGGAFRGDIHVN